jgi:hypothetical protein
MRRKGVSGPQVASLPKVKFVKAVKAAAAAARRASKKASVHKGEKKGLVEPLVLEGGSAGVDLAGATAAVDSTVVLVDIAMMADAPTPLIGAPRMP